MNFESYIGTKRIDAAPMTRGDYNKKRGVEIQKDDANYSEDGYMVRYADGYESWSPKSAFEAAYKKSGEMTFGHALELLKAGCKVARKGWNGKGMFLCFVHWKDWSTNPAETHKTSVYLSAWIGMKTADNQFVPWIASQTDMLAEDWMVVE